MAADEIDRALGELHERRGQTMAAVQTAERARAEERFARMQSQMPAVAQALREAGVAPAVLVVGTELVRPAGRWRETRWRRCMGKDG